MPPRQTARIRDRVGTSRMARCSGEAIWSALLISQEHLLSRISVPILPINSGSP